jgi:hypothetical protein
VARATRLAVPLGWRDAVLSVVFGTVVTVASYRARHGKCEHGETPDDEGSHALVRGPPDAEGHSHLLSWVGTPMLAPCKMKTQHLEEDFYRVFTPR